MLAATLVPLYGIYSGFELCEHEPASDTNTEYLHSEKYEIKTRDFALASQLAKAAVDVTDAKEAGILDTYARALFDSGKAADAVAWQKKAVAAAADEDMKNELDATLKKYEAKAGAK